MTIQEEIMEYLPLLIGQVIALTITILIIRFIFRALKKAIIEIIREIKK